MSHRAGNLSPRQSNKASTNNRHGSSAVFKHVDPHCHAANMFSPWFPWSKQNTWTHQNTMEAAFLFADAFAAMARSAAKLYWRSLVHGGHLWKQNCLPHWAFREGPFWAVNKDSHISKSTPMGCLVSLQWIPTSSLWVGRNSEAQAKGTCLSIARANVVQIARDLLQRTSQTQMWPCSQRCVCVLCSWPLLRSGVGAH